MRALWELLKRFPEMPPFGRRWFQVLDEPDNPVARLRLDWIFLSMAEDRRLERELRKGEIEYGGLFANPEVYFKIKGVETESRGFRIIQDDSIYDARMAAAARGEGPRHGRKRGHRAMKEQARAKLRAAGKSTPPVPTELAPTTDVGYDGWESWDDQGDALIVERPGPPGGAVK